MVSIVDVHAEFERLWRAYPACLECADAYDSPNPEDSRFIKMAIVGFSYHEETECWARDHFEVAHDYLCESESIGASDAVKLYSMLALGALLGMHTSGKIDTSAYRMGHATLPGFVMAKGGAVDELPS